MSNRENIGSKIIRKDYLLNVKLKIKNLNIINIEFILDKLLINREEK